MNKNSIQQLFRLLIPNIEVEIQLFSTFEELKEMSQAQDVIMWIDGTNFQNQIEPQIKWIREHHPEAIQYYACAGFNDSDREHLVWQGMWRWSKDSSIQFFTSDHHPQITSLMSTD